MQLLPQKISKQLFVRNQEEVFLKINVSSIVCNALGVLQDTVLTYVWKSKMSLSVSEIKDIHIGKQETDLVATN